MAKLFRKVINISTLGLVGGKKKKKKKEPAVAPAKRVMPIADEEAIRAAQRKRVARQLARSGRAATTRTTTPTT